MAGKGSFAGKIAVRNCTEMAPKRPETGEKVQKSALHEKGQNRRKSFVRNAFVYLIPICS
jgi:hypothetical protein